LIKSSKIYFTDVGLASHLLRLDTVGELKNNIALGGLFENMVIVDFLKQIYNKVSSDKLYFYRDSKGLEIDLIIDSGSKITPIEIKSSATFSSSFLHGIKKFRDFANDHTRDRIAKLGKARLIFSGDGGGVIDKVELVNYKNI
jgi:predicted AAA+ superfamily ATPase